MEQILLILVLLLLLTSCILSIVYTHKVYKINKKLDGFIKELFINIIDEMIKEAEEKSKEETQPAVDYNSMSINELKDMAKSRNIKGYHKMKKDELINEILDILEGKKQPQQSKTKQGRPPKNYTCNEIEERNVFSVPNITNSVTLCQPVSTINYMFKDAVSVVG